MVNLAPVITIDGLGGSGKGTIGQLLAQHLGWHYLDSGSLYRALAFATRQQQLKPTEIAALVQLAEHLPVQFVTPQNQHQHATVLLDGTDITAAIRTEDCGQFASEISAIPSVRQALIDKQRAFRKFPGLVTDGRDMGTVIFPDANLKVFLTASVEERANRRFEQLLQRGIHANLHTILTDLQERDTRDSQRVVAPTKAAPDAILIDTTHITVVAVLEQILALYQGRAATN